MEIQTTEPHLCTVDLRLRLLGGLSFFSELNPAQLTAVNQKFFESGYQPDQTIYHAGDPASYLCVVAEGMVKLFQTALGGRNVLLDLVGPGEFFGSLSTLGTPVYPDTAQAQTPACVLKVSAGDFRKILDQHPGIAMKVLDAMSARLQSANERVFLISSAPVEQRIAATLLKLAGKLGRPGKVGLLISSPLSRENLADMTGSTPESVSRVISQFQKEGWIATGRQWIAIKDQTALQKIVDQDSPRN